MTSKHREIVSLSVSDNMIVVDRIVENLKALGYEELDTYVCGEGVFMETVKMERTDGGIVLIIAPQSHDDGITVLVNQNSLGVSRLIKRMVVDSEEDMEELV